MLHQVLGRNGSDHVPARVEDVEEPAIRGVHIEEQERSRWARVLHMNVPSRFVGVITGETDLVLDLLALLDLDDVVFPLQHSRRYCLPPLSCEEKIDTKTLLSSDSDIQNWMLSKTGINI